MRLYCENNNEYYGDVGKLTNISVDGRMLKVGDVVLVSHKRSNWSKLKFVAEKDEIWYVMGAYIYGSKVGVKSPYTIKFIAGFENFTEGFKLGDIKYVKNSIKIQ